MKMCVYRCTSMSRLESSVRQGAEVECVWGMRVTRARTTKLLCGGSLGRGGEGEVCSLDLSSRGYCGQVALCRYLDILSRYQL